MTSTARALDGTAALVTGASSGIGEATAVALAGQGARVALAARRADRLEALAGRIEDSALVVEADVAREEEARAAVERTVDELGRLDIVVNNAGVMLLGPAVDAPLEEWRRMVDVNLSGLLAVTHAALPHLLRAADGRGGRGVADLVNISSVAGRVARSGSGVYNATKHAVGAFSEALRQENVEHDIRVTLIEPGAVDTELPDHNNPEMQEALRKRFEGVERLTADDIARAIVYAIGQPDHVAINEVLVRPTRQLG
jgi:NADP-dependent 3-hydroxy acid dehydrogenase YdfG